MKRIIYLFFFFIPLLAQSQEASRKTLVFRLFKVLDAYSESFIADAHVSIYEKDSTTLLVDSMKWRTGNPEEYYAWDVPKRGSYVFRIEKKGYPVTWHSETVKNKSNDAFIPSNAVYIYRSMDDTQLGEASVTASRILMVMKGDTIEYNAAAFRMQDGSMLDNLVRALPGVKLDENGQITYHGEYVRTLLVNGRDFFNGDPRVALKNLPAYTVNKVKLYRKNDHARFMGERSESEKRKDPLVMDVALKKEYAKGWISNYEVGGGTSLRSGWSERWLGRLFALRYTNHSSLAFYAHANNLNDGAMPSDKGEWKKANPMDGETKTYMSGINFSIDPKNKHLSFSTSAQAQHQDRSLTSIADRELFYQSGNVRERAEGVRNSKNVDVKWESRLSKSHHRGYFYFMPSAYYRHNKPSGTSSTLQTVERAAHADSIYSRQQASSAHETAWGVASRASGMFSFKVRHYNMLDYHADVKYNHQQTETFASDRIFRFDQRRVDPERRHFLQPGNDYAYGVGAKLENETATKLKKNEQWVKPFGNTNRFSYNFVQEFHSGHQDLWRDTRDWLSPLVQNSADWQLDQKNSYHTTRLVRTQRLGTDFYFSYKDFGIRLTPVLQLVGRRINDFRVEQQRSYSKRHAWLDAEGLMEYGVGNHSFEMGGSISSELPNLMDLLDIRDDSDPLTHYRGNAALQSTRHYQAYGRYAFRTKKFSRWLSFRMDYDRWNKSVSTAQTYDPQTGITTFQPMNVNGNWRATLKVNYSQMLGEKNHWDVANELRSGFCRSVNFSSYADEAAFGTTAVDNWGVKDDFRLNYRIAKIRVSAVGRYEWTKQRSRQQGLADASYTDFSYGLSFDSPLVGGIDFSTDLMAYCRRGYSEATMNTTDFVWNASLSKSFGKRKQWLVKAIGFDLLQQISTVRKEINAQGHAETWYNTVPSYALLSVVYRLDVKPKERK